MSSLTDGCPWTSLIIQANGSRLTPEELDASAGLESSDPGRWADEMLRLRDDRGLRLFGGCCGTDGTHLEAVAARLDSRAGDPQA